MKQLLLDYVKDAPKETDYFMDKAEILVKIDDMINVYEWYIDHLRGSVDYYDYVRDFWNCLRCKLSVYDPEYVGTDATLGMITVNVVNKSGVSTGKRTKMKIGKFLGLVCPMLQDKQKERIVNDIKEENADVSDLNFYMRDHGFADIVQKKLAKCSEFSTTDFYKSIKNSCMRYSIGELGLTESHPYDAYESGDFEIAWLELDGKLYARTVVHKKSKTYSAIYGNSKPSVKRIEQELNSLGYFKVDDEGKAWLGSKLQYVKDEYVGEDDTLDVLMAPYLDFYDYESYFSNIKKEVWLVADRKEIPNYNANDYWYHFEVHNGDGWCEI